LSKAAKQYSVNQYLTVLVDQAVHSGYVYR